MQNKETMNSSQSYGMAKSRIHYATGFKKILHNDQVYTAFIDLETVVLVSETVVQCIDLSASVLTEDYVKTFNELDLETAKGSAYDMINNLEKQCQQKEKETMNVNTQSDTTHSTIDTDLDIVAKHVTDATAFKEIVPGTMMFVDGEIVAGVTWAGVVATKTEDLDKLNEHVLTMETRLPNLIDGKNQALKIIAGLKQKRDEQTAEQNKPEETKLHGTPRWGYGDNSGLNTAPTMPETKTAEQPLNPESPIISDVQETQVSDYQKHLNLWCKRLQVSLDDVKTPAPFSFQFVTTQQAAIAAVIRPEVSVMLGADTKAYNRALWLCAAIADVVCVLISDTADNLSEVLPVSIWFARLSHDSARPRPKTMIDLVKANQRYFNYKVVQLLTARANTQVV